MDKHHFNKREIYDPFLLFMDYRWAEQRVQLVHRAQLVPRPRLPRPSARIRINIMQNDARVCDDCDAE